MIKIQSMISTECVQLHKVKKKKKSISYWDNLLYLFYRWWNQLRNSNWFILSYSLPIFLKNHLYLAIQHWQFLKALTGTALYLLPGVILPIAMTTSLSPKYVSLTQTSPLRTRNCPINISTWTLKPKLQFPHPNSKPGKFPMFYMKNSINWWSCTS